MINNILQQSINGNLKESLIIDTLQQSMINNILQQAISNSLKQSLINNTLNQSTINKILNEPTINNNLKESLINNILNQSTMNNNSKEIINDKEEIVNNSKEIINNNSKEIINNEESTINNNLKESPKKQPNTFFKTPECIRFKRAVLNPKTNDNKSFQYSAIFSLYHEQVGKIFGRPSNIKPFINNINWANINSPPTDQEYQNFEINNSLTALNILQMNDKEELSYLYKSKFNDSIKNKVNLSLLETKHYVCVKNLKSLLS